MKRILLIAPDASCDRSPDAKLRASAAPVGLATLAALTPAGIEVDIWDEAVRGKVTPDANLGKRQDVALVLGDATQAARMLEIGKECRRRGMVAVAAGPGGFPDPQPFRSVFSVVFLGEPEPTWAPFLHGFAAGSHASEYPPAAQPPLEFPVPAWDKVPELDSAYAAGAIEVLRGDISPRQKPIPAVLAEVRALERLGVKRILFTGGDFYADPKYMKDLLRELIAVNNGFSRPLGFLAGAALEVARDEEALRLLSEASFWQLRIPIGTKDAATLVEDARRLHSFGIMVQADLLVGLDDQDAAVFGELYQLVQAASIASARVSAFGCYSGSPLMARLRKEGRVLDLNAASAASDTYGVSNIIPARMTREELFEGLLSLDDRLRSWRAFGERMTGAIRALQHTPKCASKVGRPDPLRLLKIRNMIQALPSEARDVARDILRETIQAAPWMAARVLFVLRVDQQRSIDGLRERLRTRLEIEKQPGYVPAILPPEPAELGAERTL